jgi:hypothetical protein
MVSTSEQSEVRVAGIQVRPLWTVILFVLLVASALLALAAKDSTAIPIQLRLAAPYVFLAFALGFAAYRVALVAAKKYSPFKAFFQIFSAALFFLLLQNPRVDGALTAQNDSLEWALVQNEVNIRSLACEVSLARKNAAALIRLLTDSNESIRNCARSSLTALNQGNDLGSLPNAWKDRFP